MAFSIDVNFYLFFPAANSTASNDFDVVVFFMPNPIEATILIISCFFFFLKMVHTNG